MEERIYDIVKSHYGCAPRSVDALGGGFYGRVFLATLDRGPDSGGEPRRVVLKLYLYPGLARKEALQLSALARHSTVKMPAVYFVDIAEDGKYDCLAMEFVEGINCGRITSIPAERKSRLANAIVDNLISYHSYTHAQGFGELDDVEFASDWRDCYRPIACRTFEKAKNLYDRGEIGRETLDTFEVATDKFDKIFYLPITEASLIHGDYNTWNVLVSKDLDRITAVIDPFNCRYADREYDLYQLDNANGKAFGLLELYSEKSASNPRIALSENFAIKKAYYEVFTELNHFYDANVPVKQSGIAAQASLLQGIIDTLA